MMCRAWSRAARAARGGDGLADADLAGEHAEGLVGDAPGDAGGSLAVGGVPVQHAGCQVAAGRHAGEPVVGLQAVDHRSSSSSFCLPVSSLVSPGWPPSRAGGGLAEQGGVVDPRP